MGEVTLFFRKFNKAVIEEGKAHIRECLANGQQDMLIHFLWHAKSPLCRRMYSDLIAFGGAAYTDEDVQKNMRWVERYKCRLIGVRLT